MLIYTKFLEKFNVTGCHPHPDFQSPADNALNGTWNNRKHQISHRHVYVWSQRIALEIRRIKV